jgi:hypothetical protein
MAHLCTVFDLASEEKVNITVEGSDMEFRRGR